MRGNEYWRKEMGSSDIITSFSPNFSPRAKENGISLVSGISGASAAAPVLLRTLLFMLLFTLLFSAVLKLLLLFDPEERLRTLGPGKGIGLILDNFYEFYEILTSTNDINTSKILPPGSF